MISILLTSRPSLSSLSSSLKQQRFPWLSLSLPLFLFLSLYIYIHPHHQLLQQVLKPTPSVQIELMNMFLLVSQHLGVNVKKPTEVPNISGLLYPICQVCLAWMLLEIVGKWPFSGCSLGCFFQVFFLTFRRFYQASSSGASLKSRWCSHTTVLSHL